LVRSFTHGDAGSRANTPPLTPTKSSIEKSKDITVKSVGGSPSDARDQTKRICELVATSVPRAKLLAKVSLQSSLDPRLNSWRRMELPLNTTPAYL
jgi:hypothetical protein